ncbi:DUF1929 domain-containing protein [Paraburkholderia sp. WC7.3b]|uniref:DUF1929 domain-containing protein n=1 Tax=Paraburkholderia podalyriae TaxID=1938811 RepID=A0ABR7PLH6_9BURK|nr:DUF1929 domain-containing protein [Paraburkholderia podalyriae]
MSAAERRTRARSRDSGVAVPGYYMLFAVDANGVPSVSTTIRIH